MNFETLGQDLMNLAEQIPTLLLALIVLLIGFIVAKSAEKLVRRGLEKTSLDNKLLEGDTENSRFSSETIISRFVFYLIVVVAFVWFFNLLNLNFLAQPLVDMLSSFTQAVPNIVKAALIFLFAWVVATVVKKLIESSSKKMNVEKMLVKTKAIDKEEDGQKAVQSLAQIAFYLILLVFLPGILSALNIDGVSGPFANMLDGILTFIPKLFAAALIVFIGWVVARLVRKIVHGFLMSIGTEKLADRFRISSVLEGTSLSSVISTIVFVLIMIPVSIAALETLSIDGISQPAISMLNEVLTLLPDIAIAIILVLAGLALGKWVKDVVSSLLSRVGFNSLLGKMGLGRDSEGDSNVPSLSDVVGIIAQVLVVFLFVVEALQILQLNFLVELATGVISYLPAVLAAVLIIGVGLWLANLTHRLLANILQNKAGYPNVLALIAKYTIIVFSIFMALDQLGIADSIINAAFILILGALALAFGLSFGLGGRDHASKYIEKIESKFNKQ